MEKWTQKSLLEEGYTIENAQITLWGCGVELKC